jgi:ankyrin repeat protein
MQYIIGLIIIYVIVLFIIEYIGTILLILAVIISALVVLMYRSEISQFLKGFLEKQHRDELLNAIQTNSYQDKLLLINKIDHNFIYEDILVKYCQNEIKAKQEAIFAVIQKLPTSIFTKENISNLYITATSYNNSEALNLFCEASLFDNEAMTSFILTELMCYSEEKEEQLLEKIELFRSYGFNLDQSIEGKTLAHYAFLNQSVSLIEYLFNAKVDFHQLDSVGLLPVHYLSEIEDINSFKSLINLCVNLQISFSIHHEHHDDIDLFSRILISKSNAQGKKQRFKILIDNGLDIQKQFNNDSTYLHVASRNGVEKEIIVFLLENGLSVNQQSNEGNTPIHQAKNAEVAMTLIEYGADPFSMNHQGEKAIVYLAAYSAILNYYVGASLFDKGIDKINFKTSDNIVMFSLIDAEYTQIGLKCLYELQDSKDNYLYDNFQTLKKVIQNDFKIKQFDLGEVGGKIEIYFYNNTLEAKLIRQLKISDQHPKLYFIDQKSESALMYFYPISGIPIADWRNSQNLIEDILNIPVQIELYDEMHDHFDRDFYNGKLIIISESVISSIPKSIGSNARYLKSTVENFCKKDFYVNVPENEISLWNENIRQIRSILKRRIIIDRYDETKAILILKDSIEEILPRLLDLKDTYNHYPKLEHVQHKQHNNSYYYSIIPEIDIYEWKSKIRKNNLKILFDQPLNSYTVDYYDKNSSNYDMSMLSKPHIVICELSEIPGKETLQSMDCLSVQCKDKVFWGYGYGDTRHYSTISDISHLMVIGATGSGKSNFMNGIILSLIHNIENVKKLYLIDLKSGIEFNKYREMNTEKIEVFSKGTKPSHLLHALLEVEKQMYLREEYLSSLKNVVKLEVEPYFVIIDEFAQIDLMYTENHQESEAKDEIFNLLLRIGTRSRSANIKLFIQSQDPRSVPNDLKKHLMSRILLKTSDEHDRELAMQQPEKLEELGVMHTRFDKGRLVFEDYNSGNTKISELQYPYVDPSKEYHLNFLDVAQPNYSELDNHLKSFETEVIKNYPHLTKFRSEKNQQNITNVQNKQNDEEIETRSLHQNNVDLLKELEESFGE